MEMDETTARMWIDRCRGAASGIYAGTAPTAVYAERAARLLFLTGAHESGYRVRRQIMSDGQPFPVDSTAGAFSVFQMETPGIRAGLRQLETNPALRHHVDEYLVSRGSLVMPVGFSEDNVRFVLRRLQEPEGDHWALVLARLFYFRVPMPIPARVKDQAMYAKKFWNTELGKATHLDYAGACADLLWLVA